MRDNFVIRTRFFLHEQVSVSLDKWEVLCILMQYKIGTDVYIWNNSILIRLYNIFFYQMIIMLKSGNSQNSL